MDSEHGMVTERHRHRYEVNPSYVDPLEKSGLHFLDFMCVKMAQS